METQAQGTRFEIERTGEPDLKFCGELIASVSGKNHYGDSQNRWWEFRLHRTTMGKYVCSKEYTSLWVGEGGSGEAIVCESTDQIVEYFGHCDLAKGLYREAEIDASQEVA